MRRLALVASFALVFAAASRASTERAASSLRVDRTVVCQMPGVGYPDPSRFMTFSAVNGRTAVMSASNGPDYEVRVTVATGPLGRDRTGFVVLNRETCSSSNARVPLSSLGLRGGPLAGFSKTFECDVPTRVLMRVQARFRGPTAFERDRENPTLIRARGRIVSGSLAVVGLNRKPIAFATADGNTGRTRIYVAPSRCARTR